MVVFEKPVLKNLLPSILFKNKPTNLTSVSIAVSFTALGGAGSPRFPLPAGMSGCPERAVLLVCCSSLNELWNDLVIIYGPLSSARLAAWLHGWYFLLCLTQSKHLLHICYALCVERLSLKWFCPSMPPFLALLLWAFPFRRDKQAALSYKKKALLMFSYFFWFESTVGG